MTDFLPALVTFEAHQKFFTDVYLEGHTFLVKYMWPSFLMSLASTVDIQDYCFSRASRLSNRWFTFFFMLHFYNVRIVADTFANVGWTKARHSICVITQSPLHFFFFFAHSLCYYSVTVTKEGLLYWQGVSKFTFSVPWSFCVSSLLGGTSYLRQLSFWAWGMCKWGALSPRLVTAAFVIFVMHM